MPLDEQIPEYQGWQAGNRSVQTDGVVFGVKLIQVGCKFFDGIELKTLQMLRQDGMKAFYMAVLPEELKDSLNWHLESLKTAMTSWFDFTKPCFKKIFCHFTGCPHFCM